LFVFQTEATPAGRIEKVEVAVDYVEKTRDVRTGGKRKKMRSNFIRTGGHADALNIENDARYIRLDKD